MILFYFSTQRNIQFVSVLLSSLFVCVLCVCVSMRAPRVIHSRWVCTRDAAKHTIAGLSAVETIIITFVVVVVCDV